ncbi:MAG TPA: hypothetical protein VKC35_05660 [Vicinamibacterales bacterium]|nr:hypothetical protein [Vicinamibacterales bacterium]
MRYQVRTRFSMCGMTLTRSAEAIVIAATLPPMVPAVGCRWSPHAVQVYDWRCCEVP